MSSRAWAAVIALVGAALVCAVAIALVVRGGGGDSGASRLEEPIAASTSISPRIALFGDTVTARVDVTIDSDELDPALVRVKGSFAPWSQVGEPTVVRDATGSTSYVRTSFLLRCLIALCVPTNQSQRFEFKPANVVYEAPAGDSVERLSIDAQWPPLYVHSRLDAASFSERDPLAAPWRADPASLPAVTYRVQPALLMALLVVGGIALVVTAGVLGYRALPSRAEPLEELPPPPPPEPALSPLELALLLLENPAAENGVPDRRRALELVADELAGRGDRKLERTARALAWSEEPPDPHATRALAATFRELVGEVNGGHVE
jgi:hypothetical protein